MHRSAPPAIHDPMDVSYSAIGMNMVEPVALQQSGILGPVSTMQAEGLCRMHVNVGYVSALRS
jgi:hypothetical protein